MTWLVASMITVLLWGVVGLLQKMGSNHGTSNSLFVWTTVGYAMLLPFLFADSHLLSLPARPILVGVVCGITNALGAWALYTSLERGARASVAVPLTALNPLVTLILALIVLGERLTAMQTAGVVLALAAGVLLSYESEAK
jgi:transporter family protein